MSTQSIVPICLVFLASAGLPAKVAAQNIQSISPTSGPAGIEVKAIVDGPGLSDPNILFYSATNKELQSSLLDGTASPGKGKLAGKTILTLIVPSQLSVPPCVGVHVGGPMGPEMLKCRMIPTPPGTYYITTESRRGMAGNPQFTVTAGSSKSIHATGSGHPTK